MRINAEFLKRLRSRPGLLLGAAVVIGAMAYGVSAMQPTINSASTPVTPQASTAAALPATTQASPTSEPSTITPAPTSTPMPLVQSRPSLATLPAQPTPTPQPVRNGAYFRLRVGPDTMTVHITNPTTIEQARSLIGKPKILLGTVVNGSASYSAPWNFHFIPESISFADATIEVCDASIQYVEENRANLAATFPNSQWCPWGSKLEAEL